MHGNPPESTLVRVLTPFASDSLLAGDHAELQDALESGRIPFFPESPFPLPDDADLDFLREEMPAHLTKKNASYHPEADRVVGLDGDPELVERAQRILVGHAERVQGFLRRTMPELTRDWTVGTTSIRPIEEKDRDLKPHASNELVHVDAGAYGATDGDRILRFFVNVNPREDRVWATRGSFAELFERYGKSAGIAAEDRPLRLEKGPLDHARSAALRGLSSVGLPLAKVLDSSPYDRAMRRFHNFMKDAPEFRDGKDGYRELRFPPFSAWMVLTDMVSHACLSGRHALVSTFVLRLEHLSRPELAPINIMRGSPAGG